MAAQALLVDMYPEVHMPLPKAMLYVCPERQRHASNAMKMLYRTTGSSAAQFSVDRRWPDPATHKQLAATNDKIGTASLKNIHTRCKHALLCQERCFACRRPEQPIAVEHP